MAEFTIEQQRALAIARARVRAQQQSVASSYFPKNVPVVEFKPAPFKQTPTLKGATTQSVAKTYGVDKRKPGEIVPDYLAPTISAPKQPEGGVISAVKGIGEELSGLPSATKQMVTELFGTPGKTIETLFSPFLMGYGYKETGQKIDDALGITSPEQRAREAAAEKAYGTLATRSRDEAQAATQSFESQLAAPEFESMLGRGLYSGASSFVQMLPGLAASVATKSSAPALANIAAITAPTAYQKYRERGGTVEEARLGTGLETATELATEAIPLGFVVNRLGKAGFARFFREYLGRELPSELAATVTQNAIDTAIANPDKTWGDYANELPGALGETAIATLVPGTVLAGASKAAQLVSRLGAEPQPEDEFLAALQGKEPEVEATRTAPPAPPPAPPPPPKPAADLPKLSNALGPAGGKITLQEPSGPQEYTFQGFDEDGSVLLQDDAGNVFAEDPAEVQLAMQAGIAEPEMGLGAVAFGEDITEGLPPAEAPAPVAEAPTEKPKFTLIEDGESLPIDEQLLPQLKQMERSNTPSAMASLEKEARQIAADQGATSVSSLHFAQALNNAASRTAGTDVPFAGDWQQAEAPAPARPAPAPESVRTVTTPGGTKVDTAFEVVDAKDLKAATGDLQNRDRSRAATDVQVQDIFSNFDPERLGESLESDRGSPIIGPDNIVESGNGRVMAINKVYNESPERAQAYRDFIESRGYDTSGIDRPVLVRRRIGELTPEARSQFVRESNMDTKLRLSTSEQAGTDAAALTPDVMALMASPDVNQAVNRDFVRGFLSKLPTQEQAAFLDRDGNLSAEGSRRLRTAIKASAYGDADLINTLDEAQDNNIKSIGGALEDAAANWRSMRADIEEGLVRPEMDVTEQLVEAAKIVRDVRNRGQKINDFLSQQDAFNPLNPVTERFIRSFYNAKSGKAAGRDAIADVLNKYARRAREQTTGEQLIATEQLTPEQILDGIASGEGPTLFKSIEPVPVEQQQEVIEEARKIPSLSRGVTKLIKQRDEQLIDDAEFASRVTELADFIDYMKDERNYRVAQKGRVRGADRVLEVLLAAKRRGDISPEAVDFISWALQNNPNLANDLAISMWKAKAETRSSGNYSPVSRLITLFKNRGSDTTAVHELLHHVERMMPPDVQQAIRVTWLRALNKEAAKHTKSSPQKTFFQAIRAFHSKSNINFAGEILPPNKGYDIALNLISNGYVPYSYYQYVNPSEFWAVNATDIMQKRYDVKDSTLGRISNWLSELVEKAKGLFNLSAKSPLIKALDSLAKADGKFNSLTMLQEEGARYIKPETEAKADTTKSNEQVYEALDTADPVAMKKAIAKAAKPDDKIMNERANLQKQNRGCD